MCKTLDAKLFSSQGPKAMPFEGFGFAFLMGFSFMQNHACCTHCRIALCISRSEAFYRAYQRSPDNPLIQRSLNVGFPFCKKLRYRRPLDVLKWYKQFQNSFAGPIVLLLLVLPVFLILEYTIVTTASVIEQSNGINKGLSCTPGWSSAMMFGLQRQCGWLMPKSDTLSLAVM